MEENLDMKETKKRVIVNGDNIVKIYSKLYTKADIFNAALNQTIVEETSLNVAKIKKIEEIDNEWSIVMEHIHGVSFEDYLIQHPSDFDKILNDFVKLQLEVQKQKCTRLPLMREKFRKKISQINLPLDIKFKLLTRLESIPQQSKLCHGDFSLSNVMIDTNNEFFIIDWSHAAQGNGAADCAFTYLTFILDGQEKIASKYLDLFISKSEYNRKAVQKYLPIVAAAMLSYFVDNKEKFDILNKWVYTINIDE